MAANNSDIDNGIIEAVAGINSLHVLPWIIVAANIGLLAFALYKHFFVFKNAWMKIIHELEDDFNLQGFEIISLMIQIELNTAEDKEIFALGDIQRGARDQRDLIGFHKKILPTIKEIRELGCGKNLNGVYQETRDIIFNAVEVLEKYTKFDKRTFDDFAQLAIEANQAREGLEKQSVILFHLLRKLPPKNNFLSEEELVEKSEELPEKQEVSPSKAIVLVEKMEKKKTATTSS